jgi:flagellar basal body-associated protein FliL
MADEKEKSKEQTKDTKDAKGDKTKKKSLVGILIMAGIVLGGSGGGFFLAKLFSPAPKTAAAAEDPSKAGAENAGQAKPAAGAHGAPAKPAEAKPAAKPAAGAHGAPAPSGGGAHGGGAAKPTGPVLPIIDTADGWFFELDAVMANLDEPGVTRFLRASITIQFTKDYDVAVGGPLVNEKKMILRDWLTTYFAGLSIEDVRGTMSLARIKNQIRDQFNEMLFPNSKPLVHAIILKEFAVQ